MTTSTALHLTCPAGHRVGTLALVGSALTLEPVTHRGHIWKSTRRAEAETLADLAEAPDYIDPDEVDHLRSEMHEHTALDSLTLTPDRGALTWACLDCFRAGISGATHRRRSTYHHGRAKLRPFLALLAALDETATVTAMESRAKRLLATLEQPDPRDVEHLAALAGGLPAPATAREYDDWEQLVYVIPSSRAAAARWRQRRHST
ncbi:hypothetical protein TESS_TESS_00853 [Tessaracoccus sp. O5.2]|uniref:hypothetical protein n=1 Tax=Tessaracoccus sp. O5.2 TaxID=3157622 RepID=UPI0035E75B34